MVVRWLMLLQSSSSSSRMILNHCVVVKPAATHKLTPRSCSPESRNLNVCFSESWTCCCNYIFTQLSVCTGEVPHKKHFTPCNGSEDQSVFMHTNISLSFQIWQDSLIDTGHTYSGWIFQIRPFHEFNIFLLIFVGSTEISLVSGLFCSHVKKMSVLQHLHWHWDCRFSTGGFSPFPNTHFSRDHSLPPLDALRPHPKPLRGQRRH